MECFSGEFCHHAWPPLELVLIRAVVKLAHKPSARTAYRRTISTLLGIPYQNCLSLPFLTCVSLADQRCHFTACFSDTAQARLFTLFVVTIVRATSRGTLPYGKHGSKNLRRRKKS